MDRRSSGLASLSSVECLGLLKGVRECLIQHVKSALGSTKSHRAGVVIVKSKSKVNWLAFCRESILFQYSCKTYLTAVVWVAKIAAIAARV